MGRLHTLSIGLGLALATLVAGSAQVSAQAPDVRNVRPVVMLMVDTSGSMEKMGSCACNTPACSECMPDCSTREENR